MTRTGSTIAAVGGTRLRACARPPSGSLGGLEGEEVGREEHDVIGVVAFCTSSWRGTSAPATANSAA